VALKGDPEIEAILDHADPLRAYTFIRQTAEQNDHRPLRWLSSRQQVTPNLLNEIIRHEGTTLIRQAWPSLPEIPLAVTEGDWEPLVVFVQSFVHSDEITFVIDKWPEILPALLNRWTGDFACFAEGIRRDPDTLIPMLLETDIEMVRYLVRILPDDAALSKAVFDFVEAALDTKVLHVPVFEYLQPPPELIDRIFFSDLIGQISPSDAIVKKILARIPQLIETANPVRLAIAAVAFAHQAEIDPIELAGSPIDAPLFSFEFWSRIGFAELNPNDFCFLLHFYLAAKFPWLHAAIYTRKADWSVVPKGLVERTRTDGSNLIVIAQANQLALAVSFICAVCRFDFAQIPNVTGLTIAAYSAIRPPDYSIDLDKLSRVVSWEWNMGVPTYPDFSRNSLEFRLRSAVAYLQHFLPEVMDVEDFVTLGTSGVESEESFDFFLALRLFGLLADINRPFDPQQPLFAMARGILKFESLPFQIEREFSQAFAIGKFMPIAAFEAFSIELASEFNSHVSPILALNLARLLSFFNLWSLVDSGFAGRLDFATIGAWHLLARALAVMPTGKRLEFITESQCISLLPSLFTTLYRDPDANRSHLLILFSTFPSAAMSWSNSPSAPASVRQFSTSFGEGKTKSLGIEIFKTVSESALKLKLESTTITTEQTVRRIRVVYAVDDASFPVKLDLTFPPNYPFRPVGVHCEFGDEGGLCAHQVDGAIRRSQSVGSGIVSWHQFITQRLVDAEPCTVCYSYLSEGMKKPTIACPTCHQKFHGKCLSKWFSTLLKPTCPYCSSAWEEKKKKVTP
jgi:hypothetical protein